MTPMDVLETFLYVSLMMFFAYSVGCEYGYQRGWRVGWEERKEHEKENNNN